jgi:hypothetical protein
MRSSLLFGTSLVAVALVAPVRAVDIDKLVLDDANFVLSFDVKQILHTPAFTKEYQKQLEQLLEQEAVKTALKDTSFNPLTDIDEVRIVLGTSSLPPEGELEKSDGSGSGPLILIQGRFDVAKLQNKLDQLAKDMPEMVKIHGIGKANVAQVMLPGNPYFGVVLDKNTVVFSPKRDQIEDVLEKASGDRKTEWKNAELPQLLKTRTAKHCIHVAATGDAVFGGSGEAKTVNGKTTFTYKHHRLTDSGGDRLTGGITLGEKLEGKVSIVAKDEDSAKKLATTLEQGLAQAKGEGERAVAQFKDLAPVFEALKTVQVSTEGTKVELNGHGSPEALGGFVKTLFLARSAPVRVESPPAVEKEDK